LLAYRINYRRRRPGGWRHDWPSFTAKWRRIVSDGRTRSGATLSVRRDESGGIESQKRKVATGTETETETGTGTGIGIGGGTTVEAAVGPPVKEEEGGGEGETLQAGGAEGTVGGMGGGGGLAHEAGAGVEARHG
jgi:hypothetical protein